MRCARVTAICVTLPLWQGLAAAAVSVTVDARANIYTTGRSTPFTCAPTRVFPVPMMCNGQRCYGHALYMAAERVEIDRGQYVTRYELVLMDANGREVGSGIPDWSRITAAFPIDILFKHREDP